MMTRAGVRVGLDQLDGDSVAVVHGRAWMHRDLALLLYFAAVRPTKALAVLSDASLHSFGRPTGQLWLVLRVRGQVLFSSGL